MAEPQRLLRLKTALGADKFTLIEMTVTEALGKPFEIDLSVESDDLDIGFDRILGDHATVELDLNDTEQRYFDGIVTSFAYAGATERRASYRITLRPWLWLLTRTVQCKIFQEKSVPDIIKDVFHAANFDDIENKLQRNDYPVLEYCVQFKESDFTFVSRLMEQEGIYYYFEHESGVHKLVLCDAIASHAKFNNRYSDLTFARSAQDEESGSLWDWVLDRQLQSGQFTVTDYDFEKPNADLKKSNSIAQGHKEDRHEIFEWPGKYTKGGDGAAYAKLRMEEQDAQFERASGKTRTRWVATGCLVTLIDSLRTDHNREYLVIETKTTVTTDGGAGGQANLLIEFHAIGKPHEFRSPRTTPRPTLAGPQTAFVVGKSGEEIWTDKYGRVKVQFHWDRDGQNDEKSSCWIRCAQPWAGKSWGSMTIPRIGQEVVVHFLDGDPDRPLITGAVYNGGAMPPYPLPDNATRTTLMSNSSKGGNGSNEIRLEDKADSEEFYLHAQKDMKIEIIQDRSLTVQKGNETKEITQGDQTLTVKQGKQTTQIFGDTALKVDTGDYSVKVSTGAATVTVTQGVTVESTLSITLKVANNSITIDMTGITIKGTMVSVQGDVQTQIKGLMTDVEASAMLQLKGGITMIG